MTPISANSTYSMRDNINLINYLLILYAFFTPISVKTSTVIFLCISALLLLQYDLKKRFLSTIQDRVVQAFLLFYFMHVLWTIGSDHLEYALYKLDDYKFILNIIIISMAFQKKFFEKILFGFTGGMFFSEIISYSMTLHLSVPLLNLTHSMHNIPFMEMHTPYSAALSITLGLVLYNLLTLSEGNTYKKLFYLLFFTSASINIFIIDSRIGYILYSISILTVLFYIYKNKFLKVISIATFLISFSYLIAYTFSDTFKDRSLQASNDISLLSENNLQTSLGARTGYWIYGLEIIKKNFFGGVGTNDHIVAVKEVIMNQEKNLLNASTLIYNINDNKNSSLHSEYLDMLTQFGVIGVIIFLNIFYQLAIYKQGSRYQKSLQILLVTTMLVLCIGSIIFRFDLLARVFILLSSITLHTFEERVLIIESTSTR